MNRALTRALAGAGALALLFAACGGDGDDDAATTTTTAVETTTTAPEETTTSAPGNFGTAETTETTGDVGDADEAVALAQSINLTIDDFAEGWTEEPADEDEEDEIDACFTTVDLPASTVGKAATGDFSVSSPDGSSGQVVSMQTVVFDSPATATAVVAEVGTDAFADCVASVAETGASDEGSEATLTLVPQVDDPPLAEESLGLSGALSATLPDGTPIQSLVDLHVIRTAEVVSMTLTLDIGDTGSGSFEDTLTGLFSVIADRHATHVG